MSDAPETSLCEPAPFIYFETRSRMEALSGS